MYGEGSGVDLLCDGLNDSVFRVGPEGTIRYVNDRLETVTGRSAADLVGRDVSTLASFADADGFGEFRDALAAVVDCGADERRVDVRVTSPVEGPTVVEARITTLAPGAGAAVVLRDISRHKQRERTLNERTEQLAVINRVLRHDVRNDMTVVQGWAEELREYADSEEERRAVELIVEQSEHVVELTEEARELVDAVETGWEMDLHPVDAGEVLRREVRAVRDQYPETEVRFPDERLSTRVTANEYLGSVFGNLLRNAVVHNDSTEPRIRVTADRTDGTVSVRVADDGPGIPDARKATLFEKGEKGLESPGSGMGLYLVKSLVDAYGGTVTVTDADLGGAAFTVELPRVSD